MFFAPENFFDFLVYLYTQVAYIAPVRRGKAPEALKPDNEAVIQSRTFQGGFSMSKRRKKFAEGQEYRISSDGLSIGIARVVAADGSLVTFELKRKGRIVRFTERILHVGQPLSESCVPAEYDAIYAFNAIKKVAANEV